MAEFAPGMRVLIRDEEWMIRKCDPNSFNTYTLQCVGVSPLVRDKTAYFLSDLEKITVIDPAKTTLVPDGSARFTRSRLFPGKPVAAEDPDRCEAAHRPSRRHGRDALSAGARRYEPLPSPSAYLDGGRCRSW